MSNFLSKINARRPIIRHKKPYPIIVSEKLLNNDFFSSFPFKAAYMEKKLRKMQIKKVNKPGAAKGRFSRKY